MGKQWENATRDLLRLEARSGLSSGFINGPRRDIFDNEGAYLSVGSALWEGYRNAAETLADRVTRHPEALARLEGPGAPTTMPARMEAFVRSFALRAMRRTPTDAEISRLLTLAGEARRLYPTMDAFAGGARLVIEALLQSPHFLYRPELTTGTGSYYALSSFEFASRLSFALWNSIPDDALLAAAAAGRLRDPEEIRAQAIRMLDDPRAREMVRRFHHQWLETSKIADLTRDGRLFPNFGPETSSSMMEELSRFVDAVVFEDDGGLETLLTATFTVADANVARIYGIDAPRGWQRVDLGPRRPGILTRAGNLAAQSTSIEPDPIHRGVLINRNVVCSRLPSPPNDIPPLPMLDPSRTYTLRMRVDAYTGEGTCGARCHATKINPVGFAFENYDAIGAWRDTDNGLPVDASARYVFETGEIDFENAAELVNALATEPQVHACYVLHWVEYLFGRGRSANDAGLVEAVGRASLERGLSVREVILALVTSRAFRERTSTELGEVRESGYMGAP